MVDRIVVESENVRIPYKGGPRNGKNCRPRRRADRSWAIDAEARCADAISRQDRGKYVYHAEPKPHMLWVLNRDCVLVTSLTKDRDERRAD